VLQFLFSGIHPRWAFAFGNWWSRHNRLSKKGTPERKLHLRNYVEKNILGYAGKVQRTHVGKPIDFFIFGHFHYIADYKLEEGGRLIMLGEWIRKKDYLVFDGDKLERRYFGKEPNMEK
jgi:UDP-2,3-diacylglucosamine hydrolase